MNRVRNDRVLCYRNHLVKGKGKAPVLAIALLYLFAY